MKTLVSLPLFCIALIVSYRLGRCSVQDANDLVAAGFLILSPADETPPRQVRHDFSCNWQDTLTTYYYTYIVGNGD